MNLTDFKNACGTNITLCGCVYRIRKASGITFVIIRHGQYMLQAVYIQDLCKTALSELCEGAYIEATASVKEENRAEYGFELTLKDFKVISKPIEEYPLNVSQPTLGCTLDANIKNRTTALRHPRERAITQIRDTASFAFTEFMKNRSFTHISTPKISSFVTDTDYIRVKYFDKNATLTKTNTPYLIMAMGGFDSVYEIGTCYSAKNRNSTRHLNEFTRLDFETAYVNNLTDITNVLTEVLQHIISRVNTDCATQLKTLNISLPEINEIPIMTFSDALAFLGKPQTQLNLDPTDESKLSRYAKDNSSSEFIFITNFPKEKRPFYEKDNRGFVLLSNGIEIASGGEHISDYNEQVKKLTESGFEISRYESFLSAHKYALPPIGGASISLERLIMQLLRLDNIREATSFVRDLHYIL